MGNKLPGAVAPGSLIDGDFVVVPPESWDPNEGFQTLKPVLLTSSQNTKKISRIQLDYRESQPRWGMKR